MELPVDSFLTRGGRTDGGPSSRPSDRPGVGGTPSISSVRSSGESTRPGVSGAPKSAKVFRLPVAGGGRTLGAPNALNQALKLGLDSLAGAGVGGGLSCTGERRASGSSSSLGGSGTSSFISPEMEMCFIGIHKLEGKVNMIKG